MKLTTEQLAVLNHIVVDGQTWADNATEEHMLAKVARWEVDYETALAKGDYKSRKEQQVIDDKAEQDDYDNASWDVKRMREYPSTHELVVALYDTEDKAALDQRRADVKAKYPKT